MSRIAIGVLVAATAGVVSWWVSHQRAATGDRVTAYATVDPSSSPGARSEEAVPDSKMVVTPKGDIDPQMVKPAPDVDPKMVITPPWPPAPPHSTGPKHQ